VMQRLSQLILNNNGTIFLNTKITESTETDSFVVISDEKSEWSLDLLVNCTGLHTDRMYKKLTKSKSSPIKIVPFRGEYFQLAPEAEKLVSNLIYPVPDPKYPFLGIHFTRMITGEKEVGPNAVFALKREGYSNYDISIRDTVDSLSYKGFLNFLQNNIGFAMSEFGTSLFKTVFLKKAQKLIPELEIQHLVKGMAGVRAQAIDIEGKLIMDFNIVRKNRQVHVLNAPSPGATASLSIADHIINEFIPQI
jgi:(S)-2-hydroxyglutarate dehydrogenase